MVLGVLLSLVVLADEGDGQEVVDVGETGDANGELSCTFGGKAAARGVGPSRISEGKASCRGVGDMIAKLGARVASVLSSRAGIDEGKQARWLANVTKAIGSQGESTNKLWKAHESDEQASLCVVAITQLVRRGQLTRGIVRGGYILTIDRDSFPQSVAKILGGFQGLRVLRAHTGHHPDVSSFLIGRSTDSIAA